LATATRPQQQGIVDEPGAGGASAEAHTHRCRRRLVRAGVRRLAGDARWCLPAR